MKLYERSWTRLDLIWMDEDEEVQAVTDQRLLGAQGDEGFATDELFAALKALDHDLDRVQQVLHRVGP